MRLHRTANAEILPAAAIAAEKAAPLERNRRGKPPRLKSLSRPAPPNPNLRQSRSPPRESGPLVKSPVEKKAKAGNPSAVLTTEAGAAEGAEVGAKAKAEARLGE